MIGIEFLDSYSFQCMYSFTLAVHHHPRLLLLCSEKTTKRKLQSNGGEFFLWFVENLGIMHQIKKIELLFL